MSNIYENEYKVNRLRRFFLKVKKDWYILVFTTIAAITLAMGITLINIIVHRDYYQATTSVYIDWDSNIEEGVEELYENIDPEQSDRIYTENFQNDVKAYINTWKEDRIKEVLTDTNSLISSNDIRNQINTALSENGYLELNENDSLGMYSANSSHLFTLKAVGFENKERVQFLLEQLSNIIINDVENQINYGDLQVIDDISCYPVEKEIHNDYTSYKRKLNQIDKWGSTTFSKVVSIDNVTYGILGIFVGIFVIVILTFKDNTIIDFNELQNFINLNCYGLLKFEKNESHQALGELISISCKKLNVLNLSMVSLIENNKEEYLKYLGQQVPDIKVNVVNNALNNECASDELAKSDGIILCILKNVDKDDSLKLVLDKIQLIDGNILGYIFCE